MMRSFLLSLLVLHLAACSSMQPIRIQDVQQGGEHGPVQPGDRVELITRSGEKLNFAVTDITVDGIGGKFGFIPYEDIRSLSVPKPARAGDPSYSWLWGLLGIAALVALAAASDSVRLCSGSPCPEPGPN